MPKNDALYFCSNQKKLHMPKTNSVKALKPKKKPVKAPEGPYSLEITPVSTKTFKQETDDCVKLYELKKKELKRECIAAYRRICIRHNQPDVRNHKFKIQSSKERHFMDENNRFNVQGDIQPIRRLYGDQDTEIEMTLIPWNQNNFRGGTTSCASVAVSTCINFIKSESVDIKSYDWMNIIRAGVSFHVMYCKGMKTYIWAHHSPCDIMNFLINNSMSEGVIMESEFYGISDQVESNESNNSTSLRDLFNWIVSREKRTSGVFIYKKRAYSVLYDQTYGRHLYLLDTHGRLNAGYSNLFQFDSYMKLYSFMELQGNKNNSPEQYTFCILTK